jgi:hypothetical protein
MGTFKKQHKYSKGKMGELYGLTSTGQQGLSKKHENI